MRIHNEKLVQAKWKELSKKAFDNMNLAAVMRTLVGKWIKRRKALLGGREPTTVGVCTHVCARVRACLPSWTLGTQTPPSLRAQTELSRSIEKAAAQDEKETKSAETKAENKAKAEANVKVYNSSDMAEAMLKAQEEYEMKERMKKLKEDRHRDHPRLHSSPTTPKLHAY